MTRLSLGESSTVRPSWHSSPEMQHRRILDSNFFKEFSRALALAHFDALHRNVFGRSHFNPNQPRVPAGNSDGGQWTSIGGAGVRAAYAEERAHPGLMPSGQVMSDASP